MKRTILYLAAGAALLFALLQLVPYGRDHTNPPVISQIPWDAAQTEALARRACFDCHSNETVWPWYTNIAPFSWVIQRDVDEGREELNFSDLESRGAEDNQNDGDEEDDDDEENESEGSAGIELDELLEVIERGEMPPGKYLIMHPEARLTTAEKEEFIQGLQATFSNP